MKPGETLECIVCGFKPEDAGIGTTINHPSEATVFTSHGQYGSTAFDPSDGQYLEINICDQCLGSAQRRGQVLLGRNGRPIQSTDPDGLAVPTVVGWEDVRGVDPKLWTGKNHNNDEHVTVEWSEVGKPRKGVRWFFNPHEPLEGVDEPAAGS